MSKRGADRQITKDDQGSDNEGEQMEEQVSEADCSGAHDLTALALLLLRLTS